MHRRREPEALRNPRKYEGPCLAAAIGLACLAGFAGIAAAAPRVVNPSFEADTFEVPPGYASNNGGAITGWQYQGNVGINPWWGNPAERTAPGHSFSDNAIVPAGRQVALMQNQCELRQTIDGFEAGKRYRLVFRENARKFNRAEARPRLEVTLGGETIVSPHAVTPVEAMNSRTLPYHLVESAPFTAPTAGTLKLVFKTTVGGGVTVLLDAISLDEIE